MNLNGRSTNHPNSGWRSLIAGVCTVAAFAMATQATAQLTTIGPGAFSSAATTLTFEDLPVNGTPVPPGYSSSVTFSANTSSQTYVSYGTTLATAATLAGLGNVGVSWGCTGTCGTGFSLTTDQIRVGVYLSSNVPISVQVDAYRDSVLLGSQILVVAGDQIGFVGFQDPGGIDQIVIGNNTICDSCVHVLDNVIFEALAAPPGPVAPIPTLSQWGLIMLSSFLALAAVFSLRRRSQ